MHFVFIGGETDVRARHVVRDEKIRVLPLELFLPVGNHVVRFGGEAHQDLARALRFPETGQDVRIPHQRNLNLLGILLDLAMQRRCRAVVGDRRGHDDHVGLDRTLLHRGHHFGGGLDVNHVDAFRLGESHGAGNDRDRSPAGPRRLGDRVPHLARRAIGDVADGIDLLKSRTGADENPEAGQVLVRVENLEHGLDDLGRLGEPAFAHPAAGEIAARRLDDMEAARAQGVEVLPHRSVVPHVHVHRGGDEHRTGEGEGGGRQRIIRDPLCKLRDHVGGAGCDHEDIGFVRVLDVETRAVLAERPGVGENGGLREGLEGERSDELGRGPGHHDPDTVARLIEKPQDLTGFVGSDSTRDAEEDAGHLLSRGW